MKSATTNNAASRSDPVVVSLIAFVLLAAFAIQLFADVVDFTSMAACEASDRMASFVSAIGGFKILCESERPVPLLAFTGDRDCILTSSSLKPRLRQQPRRLIGTLRIPTAAGYRS